jgi:hypothetical protein
MPCEACEPSSSATSSLSGNQPQARGGSALSSVWSTFPCDYQPRASGRRTAPCSSRRRRAGACASSDAGRERPRANWGPTTHARIGYGAGMWRGSVAPFPWAHAGLHVPLLPMRLGSTKRQRPLPNWPIAICCVRFFDLLHFFYLRTHCAASILNGDG